VKVHGVLQVARDANVHHQTLGKYVTGGAVCPDVLRELEAWHSPSGVRVALHRGQGVFFGSDT